MFPPKRISRVVRAQLLFLKKEIRVTVLFRALGIKTTEEIVCLICNGRSDPELERELLNTLEEGLDMEARNGVPIADITHHAIHHIAKKMQGNNQKDILDEARRKLIKEFLPHIGIDESAHLTKAFFLAQMVRKLLFTAMGRRGFDDRDHYGNKRIDLSNLISGIVKMHRDKLVQDNNNENKTTVKVRGNLMVSSKACHNLQLIISESSSP